MKRLASALGIVLALQWTAPTWAADSGHREEATGEAQTALTAEEWFGIGVCAFALFILFSAKDHPSQLLHLPVPDPAERAGGEFVPVP